MQKELVDYIRQGLKKGYSALELKQILVKNRWHANDIDQALNLVQGKPTQPQFKPLPKEPAKSSELGKRPRILILLGVIGFIASIIIILGGVISLFITELPISIIQALPEGLLSPEFGASTLTSIFSIIIGLIAFVGFIFLMKLKKLGFWFVLVAGLASIAIGALSLTTLSIASIVIWFIIIIYLIVKRKIFT